MTALSVHLWKNYLILLGDDGEIYTPSDLVSKVSIFTDKRLITNLPVHVRDTVRLWMNTHYADMNLEEFLNKMLG